MRFLASNASQSMYLYYGHTSHGAKNGCKIQRINADEIEAAVLKHLKVSLTEAGYFSRLQKRIKEHSKVSASGNVSEIARLQNEIRELEQETTNIFRLQAQGSFGSEAVKLMSERLDGIAKKRNQYTQHLKLVETSVSESIDAGESVEYIKEKLVDFENGFSKAPAFQKKRLIRKTVKQIAVTRENLAVWFYLNEDDEQTPGRKLKLVRDEGEKLAIVSVRVGFSTFGV